MMRERPILFSGPMVRSILSGQKTQTRRIVKPQPSIQQDCEPEGHSWIPAYKGRELSVHQCPHGVPGDRLWVREAFRFAASLDHLSPRAVADKCLDAGYRTPWAPTQYEADGRRTGDWRGFDTPPTATEPGKTRPGIHMPRWASRITLEITGVRVQRLQDISDTDAQAEGVEGHYIEDGWYWRNYLLSDEDAAASPMLESATDSFRTLWESINGAGSWDANPWVWCVQFRRIDHD